MAKIELYKPFNEEATKERLKQLHQWLAKAEPKQVDCNTIYDFLAYEQTPNTAYSQNTEEEFRLFYSPMVLIPQTFPELYPDYGECMYQAFEEGDYFSYADNSVLVADERMIVNLKTQAAAMRLASELRIVSGMYSSFKFFTQATPGVGAPVPGFKFDKMVIYYSAARRGNIADLIAKTQVDPADFLPEMSSFYHIYQINGAGSAKFTVGIGKEPGGVSFTEYCVVYIISLLSGLDPKIVKENLEQPYTVKQEHLDKTAEKFSEDLFLHVHAQIA